MLDQGGMQVNPDCPAGDDELPGHSELVLTRAPAFTHHTEPQSSVAYQGGGLTGLTWGPAAELQPLEAQRQPATAVPISAPAPLARRALGEALEQEAMAASLYSSPGPQQASQPHSQAFLQPPMTSQPNINPGPLNSGWHTQQHSGAGQVPEDSDLMSDIQRGDDVAKRVRPRQAGDDANTGKLHMGR